MAITTGQILGTYQLLSLVGRGGMGEVFKAEDLKLRRKVAIKVLHSDGSQDARSRERLLQEARSASALNHPNIITIYAIEQASIGSGVVDLLVMEYLDGESLSQRIRQKPLDWHSVREIGVQIAAALEAAHEAGIIHRDIKPSNIMITANTGRVKVLDFGIAKPASGFSEDAETQLSLTDTGALAGTVAYMAPEILRGQRADSRSDIWALGVTLYEMATGTRPFQGQTPFELSSAIFNQTPPNLQASVPGDLATIIERCLKKNPAERYARTSEIRSALEAIQGVSKAPRKRRGRTGNKVRALAVLPLVNVSGDPEQEYFADGMTDALVSDLARIPGLRVISRTSAMRYKATTKALPQIADDLNVDAIVEGSVFRVGQRVRITAQLIHAATDTHLWADSYERDLQDVFGLQAEVADAISREIHLTLSPEQIRRMAGRRVNTEAYEAYLKGRFWEGKRTHDAFTKAHEYFQNAIEKDPLYPLAYVGLADRYAMSEAWGLVSPKDAFPKSKAAAQRALEIDETLAEAHATLAWIQYITQPDWLSAEAEFKKSLKLNPNYATAHQWYGLFLLSSGRLEQAAMEMRVALELDPLSLVINVCAGIALFYRREYHSAAEQFRKTIEMDPYWFTSHEWLGLVHLADSRPAEAIVEFERALELSKCLNLQGGWLGYSLAVAGRKADAEKVFEQLNVLGERTYIPDVARAAIHVGSGENKTAIELLEKACLERSSSVKVFSLNVAPMWDPLRPEQQFQELLHKMGFPRVSNT